MKVQAGIRWLKVICYQSFTVTISYFSSSGIIRPESFRIAAGVFKKINKLGRLGDVDEKSRANARLTS